MLSYLALFHSPLVKVVSAITAFRHCIIYYRWPWSLRHFTKERHIHKFSDTLFSIVGSHVHGWTSNTLKLSRSLNEILEVMVVCMYFIGEGIGPLLNSVRTLGFQNSFLWGVPEKFYHLTPDFFFIFIGSNLDVISWSHFSNIKDFKRNNHNYQNIFA